jgi:hypothetical protein
MMKEKFSTQFIKNGAGGASSLGFGNMLKEKLKKELTMQVEAATKLQVAIPAPALANDDEKNNCASTPSLPLPTERILQPLLD